MGDVSSHVADGAAVDNAANTVLTTADRRVPTGVTAGSQADGAGPADAATHSTTAVSHDAGDAGAGVQTARLTMGWKSRQAALPKVQHSERRMAPHSWPPCVQWKVAHPAPLASKTTVVLIAQRWY